MDDKPKTEVMQALEELLGRTVDPRLRAIARAITMLADGLSSAETRHTHDADEVKGALVEILAAIDHNPSKMTADQVADKIPHAVICAARQLQWKRGAANTSSAPLPPMPDEAADGELVRVHHRTEVTADKRVEDDSVVFHTQDGKAHIRANIRVKTLLGWITAAVIAGLELWHLVASGGHGH